MITGRIKGWWEVQFERRCSWLGFIERRLCVRPGDVFQLELLRQGGLVTAHKFQQRQPDKLLLGLKPSRQHQAAYFGGELFGQFDLQRSHGFTPFGICLRAILLDVTPIEKNQDGASN